jgi:NADH-quinone oxidoreductase subunit C
MSAETNTQARVEAALAGIVDTAAIGPDHDGMVRVTATPGELHAVCTALKDTAGFDANTLVTARDHGVGKEERFELFYQFLSFANADRVRVRVMTRGDDPAVDTITDLWPGTAFSERECWDLLGVRFNGHERLRRLLMPEGFDHHPLRKDFPHVGIEPDRLYRQWDEERRAEFAAAEAERTQKGAH